MQRDEVVGLGEWPLRALPQGDGDPRDAQDVQLEEIATAEELPGPGEREAVE